MPAPATPVPPPHGDSGSRDGSEEDDTSVNPLFVDLFGVPWSPCSCKMCCLATQLCVGVLGCVTLLVLVLVGAVGTVLASPATVYVRLLAVGLSLPLSCGWCLCRRHTRCAPRLCRPRARREPTVAVLMDEHLQVYYSKQPGRAVSVVGPVALGELARLIARRETGIATARIWAKSDYAEEEAQVAEQSALLDVSVDIADSEQLAGMRTMCVNEMVSTVGLPQRPQQPHTGDPTPEQEAAAQVVGDLLLRQLFPTTAVSRTVIVNVYDWNGHVKEYESVTTLNSWLGHFIGIYHSGIAVGSEEWGYGYTADDKTGVYEIPSGHACDHRLCATIPLGVVQISEEQLNSMKVQLKQEWGGMSYHILSKNCNHFCDEVAMRMNKLGSVKRVPAWVNRAAALIGAGIAIASAAQCCVDSILCRGYSRLRGSAPATPPASTASSESQPAQEQNERPVRVRADADAGTFPIPATLSPANLVPALGDRERVLYALKNSERMELAKAAGVSEIDIDAALDSNSPKRSLVALIVSAEDKAAAAVAGDSSKRPDAAIHLKAVDTVPSNGTIVSTMAEDSLNESLEV